MPGTDHPEERTVVDVLVGGSDSPLLSWVERVEDGDIVVTVGQDRSQRRVRVADGDPLELVWRAASELRSLPARLVATEAASGGEVCWRVRPTGPAARGQRRSAVRAPLSLGVSAEAGRLRGTTVDISEAGFRGVLDGPAGPRVGDVLDVVVDLGPGRLVATVAVTRRHPRADGRHEVSARFVELPERAQDQVRARVFAGLRDLRRRGLL
ncbi:putative Type IV pilus assembly PilZ [Modestobacter italicus]|uniref:Type IV pilus assembly PilZ n=1 Tax=Modestobacter italicus (strain DSM 44449 / CECT 9708 / BC 501) TaxID=2732864 RepID=I4F4F1_MODI5|nr:putative Type IV pilus assembly PilZ [Modestobacter marinus]